jgi:hypothetical protein
MIPSNLDIVDIGYEIWSTCILYSCKRISSAPLKAHPEYWMNGEDNQATCWHRISAIASIFRVCFQWHVGDPLRGRFYQGGTWELHTLPHVSMEWGMGLDPFNFLSSLPLLLARNTRGTDGGADWKPPLLHTRIIWYHASKAIIISTKTWV